MDKTESLLINLPSVIAAFGYGSGIKKQLNYSSESLKTTMDDYILIVENSREWHKKNILMNKEHYTLSRRLVIPNMPRFMEVMGTGVTFIPGLPYKDVPNKFYKIGVVAFSDFKEELITWNSLALAGRLSKPILKIKSSKEVDNLIEQNRNSVLIVSLLLLEENSVDSLLKKICSLSFYGDVRSNGFENPNKISNIVYGNYEELYDLYIRKNKYFQVMLDKKIIINYEELLLDFYNLPNKLLEYVCSNTSDISELQELKSCINQFIYNLNFSCSLKLSIKSFVTTGLFASLSYLVQKRKKAKVHILTNQK
ncbi:MAG: hypothetical protein RR404_03390 [Bacilli bacterium]